MKFETCDLKPNKRYFEIEAGDIFVASFSTFDKMIFFDEYCDKILLTCVDCKNAHDFFIITTLEHGEVLVDKVMSEGFTNFYVVPRVNLTQFSLFNND